MFPSFCCCWCLLKATSARKAISKEHENTLFPIVTGRKTVIQKVGTKKYREKDSEQKTKHINDCELWCLEHTMWNTLAGYYSRCFLMCVIIFLTFIFPFAATCFYVYHFSARPQRGNRRFSLFKGAGKFSLRKTVKLQNSDNS